MNGREKHFNTIDFDELWALSGRMAQWSEAALFRWGKLGCNWVPTPACLLPFVFFFHRFFTLWLFTVYSHC